MQTVIETKALCKQYGPHTAVDHVELHVPQGCVYGFIGPNGAGKSTTMKMLLGLIHPTAGRVRLLGQELTEKSRLPLLRQTGSLIESPAGYLHLTAQENLEIVADLKGVPHKDIGRVLDIVHLTQDRNRRVGQYSLGMKQRLGLARILASQAQLLLMDEPFASLDFLTRGELQTQLLAIQRKLPRTIVLVTHQLEEALLLGQRILVMHPDSTLRSFDLTGFSYPRDPESPALRELKREITDECRKPSAE